MYKGGNNNDGTENPVNVQTQTQDDAKKTCNSTLYSLNLALIPSKWSDSATKQANVVTKLTLSSRLTVVMELITQR